MLIDLVYARKMNLILGGAFIAPWEISQMPEDAILQVFSLEKIQSMKAGYEKVEQKFAEWRTKHGYQRT